MIVLPERPLNQKDKEIWGGVELTVETNIAVCKFDPTADIAVRKHKGGTITIRT